MIINSRVYRRILGHAIGLKNESVHGLTELSEPVPGLAEAEDTHILPTALKAFQGLTLQEDAKHTRDTVHETAAKKQNNNLDIGFSESSPYGEETGLPRPIYTQQPLPSIFMAPESPRYKANPYSLRLIHPQPRPGRPESFITSLDDQAEDLNFPTSLEPVDWPESGTNLYSDSQPGTGDSRARKQNLFRRAMKGLSNKGDKDLGRIEEMLNQLLSEVDKLRAEAVLDSDDDRNGFAATSGVSGTEKLQYHPPTPGASSHGPPRPPKLQLAVPPWYSIGSGYGVITHDSSAQSLRRENRTVHGLSPAHLGVPTRRPSGPRAMTLEGYGSLSSQEDEIDKEFRRQKRGMLLLCFRGTGTITMT